MKFVFFVVLYLFARSHFCNGFFDWTRAYPDLESLLNQLDDLIASDSVPSTEMFKLCLTRLSVASFVFPDQIRDLFNDDEYLQLSAELKTYRLKSEEIVHKLKQFAPRIEKNENGFLRDIFSVVSNERNMVYNVEAIQFYSEVRFYEHSNTMMKLYQWNVYKRPTSSSVSMSNETQELLAQYFLEKSQYVDYEPMYVFGKMDFKKKEHASLVNYGSNPGPSEDGYFQMKLLVIEDLQSLQGLRPLTKTEYDQENGSPTLVIYE